MNENQNSNYLIMEIPAPKLRTQMENDKHNTTSAIQLKILIQGCKSFPLQIY